jgi:hypothetical protein
MSGIFGDIGDAISGGFSYGVDFLGGLFGGNGTAVPQKNNGGMGEGIFSSPFLTAALQGGLGLVGMAGEQRAQREAIEQQAALDKYRYEKEMEMAGAKLKLQKQQTLANLYANYASSIGTGAGRAGELASYAGKNAGEALAARGARLV